MAVDDAEEDEKNTLKKAETGRENYEVKQLSDILRYYQKMYSMVTEFLPYLNVLATCNISIFYFLTLIILTAFLKEPEFSKNFTGLVQMATTATIFFLVFSYLCYGGEFLLAMNQTIAEAVYDLPWYRKCIAYQKLTYRFSLLLDKPIYIIAVYSTITRLRTSLSILYKMYSVLNLIKTQFVDQ